MTKLIAEALRAKAHDFLKEEIELQYAAIREIAETTAANGGMAFVYVTENPDLAVIDALVERLDNGGINVWPQYMRVGETFNGDVVTKPTMCLNIAWTKHISPDALS